MSWLIKKLVDNDWGSLGLAFRWILGTKKVFISLVNESDLSVIEKRYQLIQKKGFFSGQRGVSNQKTFIKALFINANKGSAFSKALAFSYAWTKNSSHSIKALLDFINHAFFQGPSAENNKQAFIAAVLKQSKGKKNALSQVASIQNPSSETDSLLTILLNNLTEAGCFTGKKSAENKQKIIKSICTFDKNGENALLNALRSRRKSLDESSCQNIQILLGTLVKSDCFSGPFAQSNKKMFIRAILTPSKNFRGVLSEAISNSHILEQILTALTGAEAFTTENKVQAFIDALVLPNSSGRNPLFYAAFRPKSFKLVYTQLKKIDALTKAKNKQKLITALFSQDKRGYSALLNASNNKQCSTLLLRMLAECGCFDYSQACSPNQQAFINAALAANEYNITCLYNDAINNSQILNQLMELKYFEGSFAEKNKQALMNALLTPIIKEKKQKGTALSRFCNHPPSFSLLIENLTAAGCFSGTLHHSKKQAFIKAVFSEDEYGTSLFSSIRRVENIILLLKKLEEADCFKDEKYKIQFRQAVRSQSNAILFHVIAKDFRGYLALRRSLLLAGFSAQAFKKLLNEPVKRKNEVWLRATPLMVALSNKNELLANRLIADGAALTELQKQQVKLFIEKQKKPENNKASVEIKDVIKEHAQKNSSSLKLKQERRSSLPNLSLFANNQHTAITNKNAEVGFDFKIK